MKFEVEVVQPNLHVAGNFVYFTCPEEGFCDAGLIVDEVVSKHVGELKVREGDYKILKEGRKAERSPTYTVSLRTYLSDPFVRQKIAEGTGIGCSVADVFDLRYATFAITVENPREVDRWEGLRDFLENPDKSFDEEESASSKESVPLVFDRQKTLERMRGLYEELDPKMPENKAVLYATQSPVVAVVEFDRIKAKDDAAIEAAKKELVEKLKPVGGRCLSMDVGSLHLQHYKLVCGGAKEIVRNYGDIVLNKNWKGRFFRWDP